MSANVQTETEPTVTSLVGGILHDGQELLKQQLDLFKHEIKSDFEKTREGILSLALAGVFLLVGVLVLTLGLAHTLNHFVSGDAMLWVWLLVVGAVVAGIGGGLLYYARQHLTSENMLPDESAQGLKENLQWTTKPN